VDAPAFAAAVPLVRNPARAEVTKNAKTALILASIALAFFLGIVAKYWLLR
jgi:hypothetical protein